jgi:hypothetical protein
MNLVEDVFVGSFGYALGDKTVHVQESAGAGRLRSSPRDLQEAGFELHHICETATTAYDLARAAVKEVPGLGRVDAIVYATCLAGERQRRGRVGPGGRASRWSWPDSGSPGSAPSWRRSNDRAGTCPRPGGGEFREAEPAVTASGRNLDTSRSGRQWSFTMAGAQPSFARRCSRLERFILLSTLYTAGRRTGEIRETRLDDAGFVNHYEWSKWAAEERVLDERDLPVSVLRLPTVVAENDAGRIGQYNVFHKTLKMFHRGLLSLLPGDPSTPLSLATAEFTVDAIMALLGAAPGIYHVCPEPASLRTVIDTVFTVFERDPAFRLPRPVACDRESFHELVKAAEGLRGGPLSEAIGPLSTFAEQLYLPKTFRNERRRAAWPGYRAPDPAALIEAVCTRLAIEWSTRAAKA